MQSTQRILVAISKNVTRLVDTVREYESDTFSASACELTDDEAFAITVSLINHALENLIELKNLDGVRLSEELDELRPEEDES